MSRIKLEFPSKHLFKTIFKVRINDINYGGHLGNDAALSIVHEARVRFLSAHGLSEMNVFGAGIIMTDAALTYQSEVFYGDDLEVTVAAGECSESYFELYYRLSKADAPMLTAKTGFVCFDYQNRKVRPVPEEFLVLLQSDALS